MVVKVTWKDNLASTEKIQTNYFNTMREFGKWKSKYVWLRILNVEKVKKIEGEITK